MIVTVSDKRISLDKNNNGFVDYYKAFSFIDKAHFIEFSVSSSTENNFYADELFNAVLTNFVIDGKRLYNPFKKEEQ